MVIYEDGVGEKMIAVKDIINYTDTLLASHGTKDYAPNGLQISGVEDIDSVYTAVTASKDVLEQVIARNGRFLLVHHGYFWQGEDRRLVGWMRERVKMCLMHDINLCAYHLPLDRHSQFGNNVMLAQIMQWEIEENLPSHAGGDMGLVGRTRQAMTEDVLAQELHKKLGYKPQVINNNPAKKLTRIAWCTGAAYDDISFAITKGVDAFITGEISERIVHIARESGIAFFAAGHYATEQFGVQALGSHLASHFSIKHTFLASDCPV